MKYKILLSAIGLGLIQTSNAFDLAYAYQKALVYNADYLKQIASTDATQEQINLARAQLLPQINGTATMSENYFNTPGLEAMYHQPTLGATLQQVVFDWGKYSNYSKGKYAADVGKLQLDNARQQLMVTISKAYFDVLYAEDTLQAIQMTKSALEKQMNQAKQSFKVGAVTIADVNDAMSGYDTAAAQQIQAENDLIYKKNIFTNLTGLNPDEIQKLSDNIQLELPKPDNINNWAQNAAKDNLDILVADRQVQIANQDVDIAISGHLPSLNVQGGYNYQATGGIDDVHGAESKQQNIANIPGTPLSSYGTGSLGLQLNLPIYSGGGVNAQVRQAKANYQAAQQQLVSVQRTVDQNTRNTYWQVQNGVSIVKAQQTALKSAKTKLSSDELGYQVGVRNSVDLVNSQKNYYQVYQAYQQSRYQYLLARVQLRFLTSDIDDKFINDINANIAKGN
jgi:outer membrane protein